MRSEVQAHLSRADEILRAAGDLLRLSYPADSLGRSYYAACRAFLKGREDASRQ